MRGISAGTFLLAAGLLAAGGAHGASESWLVSANGVACESGKLRLDWAARTVLGETFPNGTGNWQVENYTSALLFERQQEAGAPYLSIRRKGGPCDTAFSVVSRPVDVTAGALFDLRITARGDPVFARARGHGDHFLMGLLWLAADGQPAEAQPFGLTCKEDDWLETRVSGRVPAGAARAVIHIGADEPDIVSGHPLDIRSVTFSVQSPGEHLTAGEAVSRPIPLVKPSDGLQWQAECPAGTRVTLHVSTAPDKDGAPDTWSPFAGPDGTAASAFETSGQRLPAWPASARWLRYRIRLTTDNAARSPTVTAVRVGATRDTLWSGADHTPPALETLTPSLTEDARAPVLFRVSDPSGLNVSTLRFWADGIEMSASLQQKNGAFVYAPATPFAPAGTARDPSDAPPNLHHFRLSVEDQAANRLVTKWPLLVGERSTRNRVTLRKDGAVLIDEKPFFPVGIYAVWKKDFNSNSFDRAFAELKANGFNVAHTYNSGRTADFRAFMDAAARHGLRLFLASGQGANCPDAQAVLEDVARERVHPAVLAWYLADDTASHVTPGQLAELTEAVRRIDPDHITVQADVVGQPPFSNYSAFVGATDGFLPELYPIRGDDDVPRIITDMQTLRADIRAAGHPVKTVWPIIQYFEGWGWPRFPTADELRAMSFLALIHGANGLTWYTYGGHGKNHGATHTPETWRTLCEVAREISGLQEVLLAETVDAPQATVLAGPRQDSQGHPALSVLAKRHQGKRYLLCANSAKAEIQAALALAGAGKVTDRSEPARALSVAQGALTDTFPPYGVRVYIAE